MNKKFVIILLEYVEAFARLDIGFLKSLIPPFCSFNKLSLKNNRLNLTIRLLQRWK